MDIKIVNGVNIVELGRLELSLYYEKSGCIRGFPAIGLRIPNDYVGLDISYNEIDDAIALLKFAKEELTKCI